LGVFVILEGIEPLFDGLLVYRERFLHGSTQIENVEGTDKPPAVNQYETHRPDPD
jgi:hypothetical protein